MKTTRASLYGFLVLTLLLPLLASLAYSKGFTITPTLVDVVLRQGRWTSIPLTFVGVPAREWRIVFIQGYREGVNLSLSPIYTDSRLTGLNLTIIAYRPGGYEYGVYLVGPSRQTGQIHINPVILVPVYITVPGVRVSVRSLKVNPETGMAHLCVTLVPIGLVKLGLDGYNTTLRVIVDNERVVVKKLFLETSVTRCFRLGPYPQGSRHTALVVAETPRYSIDAIRIEFVIGRIAASVTIRVNNPRLVLLFFGGFATLSYTIHSEYNASKCVISVASGLGEGRRIKRYELQGILGVANQQDISDKVTLYLPPLLPIPMALLDAKISTTLSCIGLDKPVTRQAGFKLVALDAGVLGAYAAILAVVVYAARIVRRRRREGGGRASGEEGLSRVSSESGGS